MESMSPSVNGFSRHRAFLIGPLVGLVLATGLTGMSSGALASDRVVLQAPPHEGGRWGLKVENGFLVAYNGSTEDSTRDQIYVLDWTGRLLRSLNPLGSAAGATSITIWDVSIAPTGVLAVNAVFRSGAGELFAALLTYDYRGNLQRSFALDQGEFNKIELDEQGNIWGLGHGALGDDAASLPVIFEYDPKGTLLNQFLRRSQFPRDAKHINEGMGHGGFAAFGLAPGMVWFWLPESRQLVTMKRDGSDVKIVNTGLPAWSEPNKPEGDMEVEIETAQTLPSGQLLFEAFFRSKSGHNNKRALFLWDGAWKRIAFKEIDSFSATLVGVNGSQLVLLKQGSPLWEIRQAPLQ